MIQANHSLAPQSNPAPCQRRNNEHCPASRILASHRDQDRHLHKQDKKRQRVAHMQAYSRECACAHPLANCGCLHATDCLLATLLRCLSQLASHSESCVTHSHTESPQFLFPCQCFSVAPMAPVALVVRAASRSAVTGLGRRTNRRSLLPLAHVNHWGRKHGSAGHCRPRQSQIAL